MAMEMVNIVSLYPFTQLIDLSRVNGLKTSVENEWKTEWKLVVADNNLLSALVGLYTAGTDTTSNSLYWTFLYMVLYPEIQKKMHDEIKELLG